MVGGVGRWIPVVVVSFAVLPISAWAVRWRERAGVTRSVAVAEVGMVAGTLPWLWMILTPLPAEREVRLVPLVDLAELLRGAPVTAFFQIVGNLLVFAAFGVFAPIRWRISAPAVLAIAAAASATVEGLQFALDLGRVSSVDDVLLNTAGAGLALLAGRAVPRMWAARDRPAPVP